MSLPAILPLACLATAISLGDPIYLARWQRSWWMVIVLRVVYGAIMFALVGSWPAALEFAGICAICDLLIGAIFRRRTPSLLSGLALLLPPYVVGWFVWSINALFIRPQVATVILNAWARLSLFGTADIRSAAHVLTIIFAYSFCWGSGTFLTRATLATFTTPTSPDIDTYPAVAEVAAAREDMKDDGLDRAGRMIGNLERMLTLTLALTGSYTAIGFVVAAKSIARWELARHQGEYFLIGTLASFGIALILGMLAGALLKV